VFGYRGVILFSWLARVFDRYDGRSNLPSLEPSSSSGNLHEIRAQSVTYYQALIDIRDMPFIRAQTGSSSFVLRHIDMSNISLEAVTFLGNQERDRNLYAIPGLDYVAHEDVLPYTVTLPNASIAHQIVFRAPNERRSNMNYSRNSSCMIPTQVSEQHKLPVLRSMNAV
jgi:hypothetical protein